MRRRCDLPLLLAPAGGEEAFRAAVAAGADAVYVGGQDFNARAYAENFDEEALGRCLALAHAHGVRVYVTMNTLLTERELPAAAAYAARLWEMGADALICADVGLIACLRERLPDMPIHASTQLSLHSTSGAREVADLGFEQVVMARELTKEGIAAAVAGAPQTVEVFVHGALCVCHSGQCLFSSLVGGRSGNRGECAQPCRLPYNGGYPLSLRDLSLAEHIPALIDAGVACLKIEGRMKSPAYVWGVTRIYRRLLDERRAADKGELRALERIFSRSGFTDGYYTGQLARGMTGVRREEDKAQSRESAADIPAPAPVPLRGACSVTAGAPARLTLTAPDGRCVTVEGDVPAPARSAPLTPETVRMRLCKLGGTPYRLLPADLEVTLDAGLNLSPAALNDLRRHAVSALTAPARTPARQLPVTPLSPSFAGVPHTALFTEARVWEELGEARDFFDLAFLPLWQYGQCARPPRGVWLPPVITDGEEPQIRLLLDRARACGATHALCGNPAQIAMAREAGLRIVGDFRLNITNSHAAAYWAAHGVEDAVLSPELTAPRMRDIGGRAIVFGRIPLMVTERCYACPTGGGECHRECERGATLTDRRGVSFPVVRIPGHRNMILNSLPTYMGDRRELLPDGVREHFLFTTETAEECRRVIQAYRSGEALPFAVRRFPKQS